MTNPMWQRRPPLTGLTSYDQKRSPVDHVLEKVLPEGDVVAHAVRRMRTTPNEPIFLDRISAEKALCGATVKVLMPFRFTPTSSDVCQRCKKHYEAGTSAKDRNLEFERPTGRVSETREDDPKIYWMKCGVCHEVGQDRAFESQAEQDAQLHNKHKHGGASRGQMQL